MGHTMQHTFIGHKAFVSPSIAPGRPSADTINAARRLWHGDPQSTPQELSHKLAGRSCSPYVLPPHADQANCPANCPILVHGMAEATESQWIWTGLTSSGQACRQLTFEHCFGMKGSSCAHSLESAKTSVCAAQHAFSHLTSAAPTCPLVRALGANLPKETASVKMTRSQVPGYASRATAPCSDAAPGTCAWAHACRVGMHV